MKKILILFLSAFCLTSCKNYLDVKPVGAKFTGELETVKMTLASYLYRYATVANGTTGVSGHTMPASWLNEYQVSPTSVYYSYVDVWTFSSYETQTNALSESQRRTLSRNVIFGDTPWQKHYGIIGFMNLVLTEAATAKGDEDMRDYIMGEAYLHRAYSFFKLLQHFTPYKSNKAEDGVPVYTSIYGAFEDADLSRRPQSEVWKQITSDIDQALLRLERTEPRTSYNLYYMHDHVYRLLAQIYLWKAGSAGQEEGDWAKAAEYAQKALDVVERNTGQKTPTTFDKLCEGTLTYIKSAGLTSDATPEIPTLYTGSRYGVVNGSVLNNNSYSLDVWKTLYADNDLRKRKWFGVDADTPVDEIEQVDLNPGAKFIGASQSSLYFRLSETWLILIEALAESGDMTQAKAKLALWQATRYDTSAPVFVPASVEELREWIYLERKREFLYEGDIQWMDMKRFAISDTRVIKDETFVLEGDDWRYQFRIPDSEKNLNKIIQNPGWETVL